MTKQRGQIKGLQKEVKHKDTEVDSVSYNQPNGWRTELNRLALEVDRVQ